MPKRPLIIALAVAVPVLYLLARSSPPEARARPERVAVQERAEPQTKDELREQIAEQRRSRERVSARLADLEGRLNQLEQAAPADEGAQAAAQPRNDLSDNEIAQWMDNELMRSADGSASQEASSQLNETIALVKRADLHVEKVSCGERFCRASFYQDNGSTPVVRDLYGAPPITGEGFTIQEADGRIGVYFARDGERVSDFRDEALLAAAP